jgi:phage protein D
VLQQTALKVQILRLDGYERQKQKLADIGKARREKSVSGEKSKVKYLKVTFATKTETERAAKEKMAGIKWQMAKFNLTTAYGIPEISTESPVKLQGFKAEVGKLKWIVEKATHSFAKSGGLTTQLDLEASL